MTLKRMVNSAEKGLLPKSKYYLVVLVNKRHEGYQSLRLFSTTTLFQDLTSESLRIRNVEL